VSSSSHTLGIDLLPPINFDNGATINSWLCFKTSDSVYVFLMNYTFWLSNGFDNFKDEIIGVVYDGNSLSKPYVLFSSTIQHASTSNIDPEL